MQPWHADVSCEWAPIFQSSPPKTTRDLHPQNEVLRKIGKNNSLEPIAKARDKSSEPEKKVVSQPTYSTKKHRDGPFGTKNKKANKSTSKIIGNKLFFQKNSSVSSCWCHTMILFWVSERRCVLLSWHCSFCRTYHSPMTRLLERLGMTEGFKTTSWCPHPGSTSGTSYKVGP